MILKEQVESLVWTKFTNEEIRALFTGAKIKDRQKPISPDPTYWPLLPGEIDMPHPWVFIFLEYKGRKLTIAFSRNSLCENSLQCEFDKEKIGQITNFRLSHHRHEHGPNQWCLLDKCGKVNLGGSKTKNKPTFYRAFGLNHQFVSASVKKCTRENKEYFVKSLNEARCHRLIEDFFTKEDSERLVPNFKAMAGR